MSSRAEVLHNILCFCDLNESFTPLSVCTPKFELMQFLTAVYCRYSFHSPSQIIDDA